MANAKDNQSKKLSKSDEKLVEEATSNDKDSGYNIGRLNEIQGYEDYVSDDEREPSTTVSNTDRLLDPEAPEINANRDDFLDNMNTDTEDGWPAELT